MRCPLPRTARSTSWPGSRPANRRCSGGPPRRVSSRPSTCESVAELVGEPTYTGAYGLVASEDPAVADMPAPAVKPTADEGPHLSYALQWIAFGILAFAGLFWAFRRERRFAALPAEEQQAARASDRASRHRSADTDEEDALLDAPASRR